MNKKVIGTPAPTDNWHYNNKKVDGIELLRMIRDGEIDVTCESYKIYSCALEQSILIDNIMEYYTIYGLVHENFEILQENEKIEKLDDVKFENIETNPILECVYRHNDTINLLIDAVNDLKKED